MRLALTLLAALVLPILLRAETALPTITKVAERLYLMRFDSTSGKPTVTKSVVVEYDDYVALLEMPVATGGGSGRLSDHPDGGEAVLQALAARFPSKPLRYVLSSHWHPHSLSSMAPFITRGITVITTRKNFVRLSEMVDSATLARYGANIRFVENDSMALDGPGNSIIAYRFDKAAYPNVPTEDFLYFYLPKYGCLHCSCMFQRLGPLRGKELISSRVEDLERFIRVKGLDPRYLVTTDTYWDDSSGMVPGDTLRRMLDRGLRMSSIDDEIRSIDEETLLRNSDSIIKGLMNDGIPASYLNRAVFAMVERKNLRKALALARLQALLTPADPNAWDTFGEIYYFLGETRLAKRYEAQSRRIDKSFTIGGEEAWKKDLEQYRRRWEEH